MGVGPYAIPRIMEVVLSGQRPSHRAGVGGKLEEGKSVKTQTLRQWYLLTKCRLIWIWHSRLGSALS